MNDWMNNPAMKNIDPIKLELIKTAASKTSGKSGKELAPIMMALISGANKQGIRFTPEEMTLILDILKTEKAKKSGSRSIERSIWPPRSSENTTESRLYILLKTFFFSSHPHLTPFLCRFPFRALRFCL